MSDEESIAVNAGETHMLDYRDGRLQIVEVSPYDKGVVANGSNEVILPDMQEVGDSGQRFIQSLGNDKSLLNLDLMQLTLVSRGSDGEESYRLVTSTDGNEELGNEELDNESTVTCILQASDKEDSDDTDQQDSYMIVEGAEGPLVVVRSTVQSPPDPEPIAKSATLTPIQILERAKFLQKQRPLLTKTGQPQAKRGRKRQCDLPPPHELLASPNFRLYLYSCKHCEFKCNAVKELKAHRNAQHGAGWKPRSNPTASALQCARCPYRADTQKHLMNHLNEKHLPEPATTSFKVSLNSKEAQEADILVCGACGFESALRDTFREHIERVHGAHCSL